MGERVVQGKQGRQRRWCGKFKGVRAEVERLGVEVSDADYSFYYA